MRILGSRIGKPSSKWALFRWYDIVLDDKLYLTRLNLIKTPWFSIKLHWIHRPDPDRDLHDHPWWFFAFILRGGYLEYESKDPANKPGEPHVVSYFNYKNKATAHRITDVLPNTTTLVFSGPKDRKKEWGFYDAETLEYIDWQKYEEIKK